MKKYFLATALVGGVIATYALTQKSDAATNNAGSAVLSSEQEKEVENIIRTYLQENPKEIMQAIEAAMALAQLEEMQKMQQAVSENQDKLFKDDRSPIAGNPNGSQKLAVFMDPYCGFCKKFHSEVEKALKDNKDVKVVFKDIAIMGPGSKTAVLAMLAAQKQNKYHELQEKILKADKRLTKKQIIREASSIGIDTKKLEADMDSDDVRKLADDTMALAKELGVNATPTLIIGETIHPGYLPADQLNAMLKGTPTQN